MLLAKCLLDVFLPSVIITGVVRVILGYPPGSRVPSYHNTEVWATVHTGMAIVCASLPIFKPLVRRIRSAFATQLVASFHRRFSPQTTRAPGATSRTRTPSASMFESQASADSSINPYSVQKLQPAVVDLPLQIPEPAAVHGISFSRTWQLGLQERGYFLSARDGTHRVSD